MKTSAISPVESRVLTRLSPSEPPGRVSCLTVMFGLAAWKAAITAFALATSVSVAPVRNVIVVAPALPSPLLLPRLPALHPAANSVVAAARAGRPPPRRPFLLNLIGPPGRRKTRREGKLPPSEAFQGAR